MFFLCEICLKNPYTFPAVKEEIWYALSLGCAAASLLHPHSSHTQTAFLLNGLQLICADGLCDQIQFLTHGLVTVCHTNVRNIGAPDVIALLAFLDVMWAKPVALHLFVKIEQQEKMILVKSYSIQIICRAID